MYLLAATAIPVTRLNFNAGFDTPSSTILCLKLLYGLLQAIHLTRIKGIASIKSSFSLKQVSYKTALPLPS
jgi:hypothetical protein